MRLARASLLAGLTAAMLAACAGSSGASTAPTPSPSPTAAPSADQRTAASACAGRATPAQTEGPFFKSGSPERTSLIEPGMPGTRLLLTGRVMTADCKPVVNASLDFWQADATGVYDNSGYRLRGRQRADADGRYTLETVVPGLYTGRTAHIHVKVQAPGKPVLTTQLYLPGLARNQQDAIFNPALVMDIRDTGEGKAATFDFVVP